jgi:hypothetical protein
MVVFLRSSQTPTPDRRSLRHGASPQATTGSRGAARISCFEPSLGGERR